MKNLLIILLAALCLSGCTAKSPESPALTESEQGGASLSDAVPEPSMNPSRLPEEVEKLQKMLSDAGVLDAVKREDVGEYSFDGYEHTPVGFYTLKLKDDEPVCVKLYDSPEAAADEASNYGSDGSSYGYDGGGMVIDYLYPVHMWLSGDAIIEFGSADDTVARLLRNFYGEQFAGAEISELLALSGFSFSDVSASAGETSLRDAEAIGSRAELEDYYNSLKNSWYWSPYTEPQLSEFEAKMKDYPEEWFENRSLVIVYAASPSSPADFTVAGVEAENGGLKIIVTCEQGDDTAEVEKYIFIELEGVSLGRETPITLINSYDRAATGETDNRPRLSVEKLREIISEGGELSLSDFEGYRSDDVGSGIYILRYFLQDRGYLLLVGFQNPEGEPDYIRLVRVYEDREDTCEIGTDDLDEFLSRNGYEG